MLAAGQLPGSSCQGGTACRCKKPALPPGSPPVKRGGRRHPIDRAAPTPDRLSVPFTHIPWSKEPSKESAPLVRMHVENQPASAASRRIVAGAKLRPRAGPGKRRPPRAKAGLARRRLAHGAPPRSAGSIPPSDPAAPAGIPVGPPPPSLYILFTIPFSVNDVWEKYFMLRCTTNFGRLWN